MPESGWQESTAILVFLIVLAIIYGVTH